MKTFIYYVPEFNSIICMTSYRGKNSTWYRDSFFVDTKSVEAKGKTPITYLGIL